MEQPTPASDLYCTLSIGVWDLPQERIDEIAHSVGNAVMHLGAQTNDGTLEWRLGPITNQERAHTHLVNVRRHTVATYGLTNMWFEFYHYPDVEIRAWQPFLEVAVATYRALIACGNHIRAEEYRGNLLRNSFEDEREALAFTRRYVNLIIVQREEEQDVAGSEEPYQGEA